MDFHSLLHCIFSFCLYVGSWCFAVETRAVSRSTDQARAAYPHLMISSRASLLTFNPHPRKKARRNCVLAVFDLFREVNGSLRPTVDQSGLNHFAFCRIFGDFANLQGNKICVCAGHLFPFVIVCKMRLASDRETSRGFSQA